MMTTSDDVLSALSRLQGELVRELRAMLAGSAHDPERPLRQRDVLRSLLAANENRGGTSSSITISRNAKGDAQFEVTVRSGDSPEIQTAADAHAEAVRIFDALSLTYKRAHGAQS